MDVLIFEPTLNEETFFGSTDIKEMDVFNKMSDVIVAKRYQNEMKPMMDMVYTCDLYFRD